MTTQSIPRSTNSRLLSGMVVADRLGISRSSAYQLMRRGDIPTIRFGGTVRVRECDLEEFIQRAWSGWKQE